MTDQLTIDPRSNKLRFTSLKHLTQFNRLVKHIDNLAKSQIWLTILGSSSTCRYNVSETLTPVINPKKHTFDLPPFSLPENFDAKSLMSGWKDE